MIIKKEIYKDNNMENNKQAENKEDNLNQFDLDVLFMEPPYQGKTRQSKRLCTKKA